MSHQRRATGAVSAPGTSRNSAQQRPKMDGRATYHGLYTPQLPGTPPRYPNYLPVLHAQRAQTAKQDSVRAEARRQYNEQRRQDEMVLNRMVMGKVKRIAFPNPTTGRDHRIFSLHPKPSKSVGRAREVLSIFRAPPRTFSDSGSPLLQLDLIRHGVRPRHDVSDLTLPEVDSDDGQP